MENTESLEEKKTKYSEEDLIKLLKKIGKENSEIFFDKAIELVERLNIDKPDDRLTFGTSQNARLAITIGQRYCLAFIPNRLKPWSFIVSKEVPSNSSIVSSIFNGKPIAYYCESLEAKELINRFEDVVDASKVELKTTDKSGFRKFNNPYFEKTIFDAMYRNELFDKAFNVEETEISEIYRNLTFNSSNDVCLKDIYVVLYLMKKRGKTANDAYKLISSATKKRFQTISDACTRRLANKGQSYFESSVKSKEVLQDIKTKFKLNEDDNKKFNDLFIDGTKKLIKNTNMNVKIKGQDDLDIKSKTSTALNQILYGPPGTGKTFNSIDKAVEIASPERFISGDHLHNKLVFDELRKQGQIEFVTFHQNYSYEDFMVGIRPDVDNDVLRFKRMKGIFYEISNKAKDNYFDSIKDPEIVSYESWVKITFEKFKDHIMDTIEKDGKYQIMNSVSIYSVEDDAFIYTGEKKDGQLWKNERLGMHYEPLLFMFNNNVLNRKDIQNLDVKIPSLEKQHSTYCLEVINKFREFIDKSKLKYVEKKLISIPVKNYVIIIDEINRANISKVFGELITLLEDDKRLGQENELKITLPNGEKDFGIPPNLYVIGTMNTADKSIALIDIALRRRFEFIGFYPIYNGYNQDAASLLKKINEAIYVKKKSADYLIGHAYFMKGQEIITVLKNKVIPLLMEYFSGKTDIVAEIFKDSGYNVSYNTTTYSWDIK